MGRSIAVFLLVWISFMVGIYGFQKLTGAEKWNVVKIASYGLACALLALFVLSAIVFVF